MDGTVRLSDIYNKYKDQVQFLHIYIREAHPVDGWWMGGGIQGLVLRTKKSRAALDVYEPTTIEERQAVASRCSLSMEADLPLLIDKMDNKVNDAYAALPTRLYLVGTDGIVKYAAGKGPWGFKPAEFDKAIERYLATGN